MASSYNDGCGCHNQQPTKKDSKLWHTNKGVAKGKEPVTCSSGQTSAIHSLHFAHSFLFCLKFHFFSTTVFLTEGRFLFITQNSSQSFYSALGEILLSLLMSVQNCSSSRDGGTILSSSSNRTSSLIALGCESEWVWFKWFCCDCTLFFLLNCQCTLMTPTMALSKRIKKKT
jgi:hypothetical protein